MAEKAAHKGEAAPPTHKSVAKEICEQIRVPIVYRLTTVNAGGCRQRTQFGPQPRRWDAIPGRRGLRRLATPPAYYDNAIRITVIRVKPCPFCRIQLPARLRERGETPYSTEMADDRGRALHGTAFSPLSGVPLGFS